jgi:hypothetical protein
VEVPREVLQEGPIDITIDLLAALVGGQGRPRRMDVVIPIIISMIKRKEDDVIDEMLAGLIILKCVHAIIL